MRAILCLFGAILATSTLAQNTIELQLFPKYSGQDLTLNQTYSDGNGQDFVVTRLQFFLYNFTITHDGGQTTTFNSSDSYVLANANSVSHTIGTGNITDIESISFTVGVDSTLNHDDPTQWAANHPLAPQNPSMHWGWSAGYRFLALEAEVDVDGDGNLETLMQSHVVGDEFKRTVSAINISNDVVNGNTVVVALNYDVANWMTNLDFGTFGVNHGGGVENTQIMDNTDPEAVFSEGTVTGIEQQADFNAELFVTEGQINFNADQTIETLEVFDLTGKLVFTKAVNAANGVVTSGLTAGVYIVRLRAGDQFASSTLKF